MAKVIKVYVVGDDMSTLFGQRVKEYGGTEQRTDSNGCVTLLLDGTNTTIFVNGFKAYDGSVSNLDSKEIFTKTGGRP